MPADHYTEETPKVNLDFLHRTLARVSDEVAARRALIGEDDLRLRVRDRPGGEGLASAISKRGGVSVIAEIKRRSPTAGPLAPGLDAAARARLYWSHGAAAVSVLTDGAFDGALADLSAAADAVPIPVLRKDFIIDPYQVWEARAAGARAILIILAAVSDGTLRELDRAAGDAGVELLVECHSAAEGERALAIGARVIGVNARNLATLEVAEGAGLAELAALRRRAGPEPVLVAESGIRAPADVARARAAGADAVLVGEHLMRAADPGAALAALVQAGAGRP